MAAASKEGDENESRDDSASATTTARDDRRRVTMRQERASRSATDTRLARTSNCELVPRTTARCPPRMSRMITTRRPSGLLLLSSHFPAAQRAVCSARSLGRIKHGFRSGQVAARNPSASREILPLFRDSS